MTSERFTVGLTPLVTASRVAKQRSALRFQLVLAALIGAVLLLAWLGPQFLPYGPRRMMTEVVPSWSLPTIAVAWVLWTFGQLGVTLWALSRAKRDLTAIGHGEAIAIDAEGIEFLHPTPVRASWADVSGLRISGSAFGAGPELKLEVGGEVVAKIPISFLDAMPAAIDSAVGARSMGRIRVDVSAMDRMI
ncbi:MAG: hypothetical protein Q4D79_05095 [Propionibacteriaceae bacterium]|nr:hypothetical protein [Propionibacteriaceae bacterium]